MAITRFSNQYPTLLDRLFNGELYDWSNKNFSSTSTSLPMVNIKESTEGFDVELAAPGYEKKDFKIESNHGVLTISSEKTRENVTKEGEYFSRQEYSYQSFCRSFTLPDTADTDKINATYENGILKVSIPKKEEAKPKPAKLIQVK